MTIKVEEINNDKKTIVALAKVYYQSYMKLSKEYKSEKEMALYSENEFVRKIKDIAAKKDSKVFVCYNNEAPVGFVRYSPVPQYYRKNAKENAEVETFENKGHTCSWKRKLKFLKENNIDDKTVMLNQIYISPNVQKCGAGFILIEQTLPKIQVMGYENLVIEYNKNNKSAAKFYKNNLGLEEIGETQDFDNVITKPTKHCLSPVIIGFVKIDKALNIIEAINKVRTSNATRNR